MDPGKVTTDCKQSFPYTFIEECMGCADRMSKETMGVQAMISLTAHLESVGETYFQHFRHAISFSLTMFCAGVACSIHALLPFLFETTGSDSIRILYDKMVINRKNLTPASRKRRPRKSLNKGVVSQISSLETVLTSRTGTEG